MTSLSFYNSNAEKLRKAFSTFVEMSVPLDERSIPTATSLDFILPTIPPEASVLDVGCGWGSLANYLPATNKYTGIDFSPQMLSYANKELPNAEFKVEDYHLLPFEDESFDYILANECLNYGNVARAHGEIARVLKPNGVFYSKVWLLQDSLSENYASEIPKEIKDLAYNCGGGIESEPNVFGLQPRQKYVDELDKLFSWETACICGNRKDAHLFFTKCLFKQDSYDQTPFLDWTKENNIPEETIKSIRSILFAYFSRIQCAWSREGFFRCVKK